MGVSTHMLIYEKEVYDEVESKNMRKLFGTLGNVPSNNDLQLAYVDSDANEVGNVQDYKFFYSKNGDMFANNSIRQVPTVDDAQNNVWLGTDMVIGKTPNILLFETNSETVQLDVDDYGYRISAMPAANSIRVDFDGESYFLNLRCDERGVYCYGDMLFSEAPFLIVFPEPSTVADISKALMYAAQGEHSVRIIATDIDVYDLHLQCDIDHSDNTVGLWYFSVLSGRIVFSALEDNDVVPHSIYSGKYDVMARCCKVVLPKNTISAVCLVETLNDYTASSNFSGFDGGNGGGTFIFNENVDATLVVRPPQDIN